MQQNIFPSSNQNLISKGGLVTYHPSFFSIQESMDFMGKLRSQILWVQEPIKIFGKEVMQPRLTALYGEESIPYSYSGITMKTYPWTSFLLEIKSAIEEESEESFTHVLLNYYRDGNDSMGWHRDNEPSLGENPTIASVTFGASRTFQLREYSDKKNKVSIELDSGSLLIMKGETQRYWEHQLPKRKRIREPRINLTFRRIKT